jgi:NADH-quinone oxidoreductase subunit N
MNSSLIMLEVSVIGLGLVLMLADLFVPAERRRFIGYAAIAALGVLLVTSLSGNGSCGQFGTAFGGMFVNDALSLFFKQLFIVAAILVLFMAAEFSDKLAAGSVSEYYSLIVFALAGMLFAASSNDFTMLFVSIELITITFYVLVSFQRSKLQSLEAGVKYLILGALSSSFMVFGIALIWGTTGELNFTKLAAVAPQFEISRIFLLGVLLVLVGLGFKIAAFPFQIWAPDVYQGAPTPTTAFLAVGSKAAGFVLLLRVLFTAVPSVTATLGEPAHRHFRHHDSLRQSLRDSAAQSETAARLFQHRARRLSAAGRRGLSASGQSAVMYYLAGYVFTVMAAFFVITLVMRHLATEDISGLAGLNQRSPLLAATLTIAMVSLAGIPPLAGFFGKFLLLKSVIEAAQTTGNHGYYCLAFTALAGVIISLYYYFGVIRAIYWSKEPTDLSPITLSSPAKFSICVCIAGIFWLGLFPNTVLNLANQAAAVFVK